MFLKYEYYAFLNRTFPYTENDYSLIERSLTKKSKEYSLKVSVITPLYNRKNFLDKTLAALTHQTYPVNLFEVIIADDGSNDGVDELVEKYKNRLNVKIVSQEDRGYRLAAIRNKAIKAASGEVIISLDCDVLPVPRLIEEYMKWFHATDKNIVVLGLIKLD